VEKLPQDNPASANVSQDNVNTTQAASTNFVDNGTVIETNTRSIDTKVYGPAPYDSNEIADFLAKPVRVNGGELLTSDTVNQVKFTTSISSLLNSNQIWYRKIAGYNLIRATCNVKLVVNANPFQQGRLILNFIPGWRHLNTGEQAAYNVNLGQVTTSPNIELDMQDTSVEFSIPYISPFSYFDRIQDLYDWGTIWLRIISPLQTGSSGSTSCEYAIFVHWTDVELAAPIFGPEMNASGSRKTVAKLLHSREANKANSKGFIESASDKVMGVANLLSGYGVPGASLVSAAADAAGSIASIFGWSKPVNSEIPKYVIAHPMRGTNIYDSSNNADSMGMSNSPLVPPNFQLFGSTMDEMSWDFLKAVPAYLTSFNFSTSNVYNDLLYSLGTAPGTMLQAGTKTVLTSTVTYGTGSPAFWLAQLFGKYRGGIKVTFKFVKTAYHSGRIAITYVPNSSAGVSFDQSVYVLREIVDLRTSSEISLVLPYVRAENYLPINTASGLLQVRVLNELRTPETASQDIKCLVYVSGAPDFELACPTPRAGIRHFTPEMDSSVPKNMVEKGIGDSVIQIASMDHNTLSIGDPFVSIKQLLNCSRRVYSGSGTVSSQTGVVAPFALAVSRYTTSGTAFADPDSLNLDYLALLSNGYSFFRGGIRITRTFNAGTVGGYVGVLPLTSSFAQSSLAASSISTTTVGTGVSTVYTLNQINIYTERALDINVPFWNNTPISYVRYQSTTSAYPTDVSYPDSRLFYSLTNATTEIYRSGMDDYCLGYFRGFMPIVLGVVP